MIKAALAVAIFVLGLLSVLAPQRLVATNSETAQHWFSLGNMAASGVLLSAGLVHMLADSARALSSTTESITEFPLANFVAGLTFIGFMVLEESLHLIFMSGERDGDDPLGQAIMAGHDHGHGHAHETKTETNGQSKANHHPQNSSVTRTSTSTKQLLSFPNTSTLVWTCQTQNRRILWFQIHDQSSGFPRHRRPRNEEELGVSDTRTQIIRIDHHLFEAIIHK